MLFTQTLNTGSRALPEAPTSHQITSEIHPFLLAVTDLCPTFLGSRCPQAVTTSPAPTRPWASVTPNCHRPPCFSLVDVTLHCH